MDTNFIEASSLASIDRQIEAERQDISPAQYEIIRHVIYNTADFEYYSIIRFAENALQEGFNALKSRMSIIVDVPEIQVGIVPQLQKTFYNPVYCCATTGKKVADFQTTRAAFGLENLATSHPESIFIIGQDQVTLNTLVKLIKQKTIRPSLVISTVPLIINQDAQQYLKYSSIPAIYVDSPKGSAIVSSSIMNALINLAWRAHDQAMVKH